MRVHHRLQHGPGQDTGGQQLSETCGSNMLEIRGSGLGVTIWAFGVRNPRPWRTPFRGNGKQRSDFGTRKLSKGKGMKISAIGFPWFQEEEYDQLRSMFEDGESLHRTFHEWLQAANLGLAELQSSGHAVVKAHITVADFPIWCAKRKLRLNSEARKVFASEMALQHYRELN